jgi:hypothetical protein
MEHSQYGQANSLSPGQEMLNVLSKLEAYLSCLYESANKLYSKQNVYNLHQPIKR